MTYFRLLLCLAIIFTACNSDDDNGGVPNEVPDPVLSLVVNVGPIGDDEATLSWAVEGSSGTVSYSIILNGEQIISGFLANQFLLTGLEQATEYSGSVTALDSDGDSVTVSFGFTTESNRTFVGDFVIDEQSIADSFDYTVITGSLTITGTGVTDISNLSILTEVENIYVNNTSLRSLDGLKNLERWRDNGDDYFGQVILDSNNLLEEIFESGEMIPASAIRVWNSPRLTSLTGLKLLDVRGPHEITGLSLNNIDIPYLGYFSNVRELDFLYLSNISGLFSLQGLSNLEKVYGDITIAGLAQGMDNLEGFNSLQEVSGVFKVNWQPGLSSLNGLESLSSVGTMELTGLITLTDMSGISNLSSCTNLKISGAESLTTLPDIPGLTDINVLSVTNCDLLIRFGDMSNLESASIINLTVLPRLEDIDGLGGLGQVSTRFELNGLERLSSLQALSNLGYARELFIEYLPQLNSLSGLNNLQTSNHIRISNCNSLQNLNGTSLVGSSTGQSRLQILSNTSLHDLCGFTEYARNVNFTQYQTINNAYNPSPEQLRSSFFCRY